MQNTNTASDTRRQIITHNALTNLFVPNNRAGRRQLAKLTGTFEAGTYGKGLTAHFNKLRLQKIREKTAVLA